jgi:hypothetical protein
MKEWEFHSLVERITELRAKLQDLYDADTQKGRENVLSVSQELDRLITKFYNLKSNREH